MLKSIILELQQKNYILKEERGEFSVFYYLKKGNDQYIVSENLITKRGKVTRRINGIEKELELDISDNQKIESKHDEIKVNRRVRHINKAEWGIGFITRKEKEKIIIEFSQDKEKERKIKKKYLVKINIKDEKKGILKYSFNGKSIDNDLQKLISKINNEEKLTKYDIQWLEEKKLYDIIAKNYELSNLTLAKASSYWRKAYNPERALEITKNLKTSPLLTSRGGAFKDIWKITQAKECAEEAVKLDKTDFHPYNLLGSIYFHTGEKVKGESYFKQAINLGSPLSLVNNFKKNFKKFLDYEN